MNFFSCVSFFYISLAFISLVPTQKNTISTHFRHSICKVLLEAIKKETKSIFVTAYSLTNPDISKALINAHHKGVKIEIIIDQSALGTQGTQIFNLIKEKIPVYFFSNKERATSLMHNKLMIFESQAVVITGSYNFSINANYNAENIVVIESKHIYEEYKKEFIFLKKSSTQVYTKV